MAVPSSARLGFFALFVLLAAGNANAQKPSRTANFQAGSQMVLVPVTVTDRNGKSVQSLQPNNFTIFDDRAPQQIISFTNEDAPCSIGLVLDISGSMKTILGIAKDA